MEFCSSKKRETKKRKKLGGIKKLKNVSKRKGNKTILCLKPPAAGRDWRACGKHCISNTFPLFINILAGKEPLRILFPNENSTVHNNNTKEPQ